MTVTGHTRNGNGSGVHYTTNPPGIFGDPKIFRGSFFFSRNKKDQGVYPFPKKFFGDHFFLAALKSKGGYIPKVP